MDGNLARNHSSDDQLAGHRGRTRPQFNVIASNRQNSTPGQPLPAASTGEHEIFVDAGLWVIFNRRLLAAIIRKP